jgi:hypothetical protein
VLTAAAAKLERTHVLMLNKEDDELFPPPQVRRLFAALEARSKQLNFSSGSHDDWDKDLLDSSASFVRRAHAIDGDRLIQQPAVADADPAIGDACRSWPVVRRVAAWTFPRTPKRS